MRASLHGSLDYEGVREFGDWVERQAPDSKDQVVGKALADMGSMRMGRLEEARDLAMKYIEDGGSVVVLEPLKKRYPGLFGKDFILNSENINIAPKPAGAKKEKGQ